MVKNLYDVFYIICIMLKDYIIYGTLGRIFRNLFPLQCDKLVYTKEVLDSLKQILLMSMYGKKHYNIVKQLASG